MAESVNVISVMSCPNGPEKTNVRVFDVVAKWSSGVDQVVWIRAGLTELHFLGQGLGVARPDGIIALFNA